MTSDSTLRIDIEFLVVNWTINIFHLVDMHILTAYYVHTAVIAMTIAEPF